MKRSRMNGRQRSAHRARCGSTAGVSSPNRAAARPSGAAPGPGPPAGRRSGAASPRARPTRRGTGPCRLRCAAHVVELALDRGPALGPEPAASGRGRSSTRAPARAGRRAARAPTGRARPSASSSSATSHSAAATMLATPTWAPCRSCAAAVGHRGHVEQVADQVLDSRTGPRWCRSPRWPARRGSACRPARSAPPGSSGSAVSRPPRRRAPAAARRRRTRGPARACRPGTSRRGRSRPRSRRPPRRGSARSGAPRSMSWSTISALGHVLGTVRLAPLRTSTDSESAYPFTDAAVCTTTTGTSSSPRPAWPGRSPCPSRRPAAATPPRRVEGRRHRGLVEHRAVGPARGRHGAGRGPGGQQPADGGRGRPRRGRSSACRRPPARARARERSGRAPRAGRPARRAPTRRRERHVPALRDGGGPPRVEAGHGRPARDPAGHTGVGSCNGPLPRGVLGAGRPDRGVTRRSASGPPAAP